MGHPGQKIWDGTSRFWVFGQKPLDSIWLCIKKPPQPYGLQKKPRQNQCFSHFGSFGVILRSFYGHFVVILGSICSIYSFQVFSKKFEIFKDFLDDKISNCCVFLIWGHLGSFYGHFTVVLWSVCGQFGLNWFNLLILGDFFQNLKFLQIFQIMK